VRRLGAPRQTFHSRYLIYWHSGICSEVVSDDMGVNLDQSSGSTMKENIVKRETLPWLEYLRQGVDHMEGTTPDGTRSYHHAALIFEECTQQDNDPTVKAEAHFRRAQVAHYQKHTLVARQWINSGLAELPSVASPEKQAQCRLIEGIVLEDEGQLDEARKIYDALWMKKLSDYRLRGNIANRMARLIADVALRSPVAQVRSAGIRDACEWIMRAEQCFSGLWQPGDDVHHALAAVKSRAALFLLWRSQALWQEANQLFKEGKVRDPFIRATYWYNRIRAALVSLQPLRALWYFIRFLWSYKDCKK
jgi:tetratricopeptide (TPR) repeat protein